MKITDVITISDNLYFPYGEENTRATFDKYKDQDNVVAFLVGDVNCFILIKGRLKFFAFKINMNTKVAHREKKLYELSNKKYLCIRDKKSFGLLKKTLILDALNKNGK